MTTSWMWQTDQGVNGLRIDIDNKLMRWYDVIGCGCGMDDLAIEQSVDQYKLEGTPANLQNPPQDVLDEIDTTVSSI
ncbi:MAG: hypothetical protein AAF490_02875 [Chloroflexota bacterium]